MTGRPLACQVGFVSVLAYVGLGSNLGDRILSMRRAVRDLSEHPDIVVRRTSAVYETEPAGVVLDQPDFLNAVVELDTTLSAADLLDLLLIIEIELGRERSDEGGPRPIDLDLLIYGDLVVDGGELVVPHPELAERRFVLRPLVDLQPDLLHPRDLYSLAERLDSLPPSRCVRQPHLSLEVG